MRRALVFALALVAASAFLWPNASAAATAEPVFPPSDLHRAERAGELAQWIYERMGAPPLAPTRTHWQNLSQEDLGGRAMLVASEYEDRGDGTYYILGYTSDGFLRQGSVDLASNVTLHDRSEESLRSGALEVAARLGLPSAGLRLDPDHLGFQYATLTGALPWGAPLEANSFFVRFDGPNLTADRLVFAPWFAGAGSPTVSRQAAEQTALSAAAAVSGGAPLSIRQTGASVTGGTHPAWVVQVAAGACSTETASYFVDAEGGSTSGEGPACGRMRCAPRRPYSWCLAG